MHIFFITEWFPTEKQPFYGLFIKEHARAVAEIHNVSLLHIRGIDPNLDRSIKITPNIIRQGFMVYQLSYRHPMIPFTSWVRQFHGAWQVFKLASQKYGRPCLIHANISNTADVSVFLGHLVNIPVILSEHSSAYGRKLIKPAQIPLMRFFMNQVDLILPVCDALGQDIRKYGITRPMISVQNAVDIDAFFPASPGEQVVSPFREITIIARLNEEKAVHLAIEMIAKLRNKGINLTLNIIGDGPERAHLWSIVEDLGLTEWINFHGSPARMEMARLLRRSSAFVLSSLWENQPVAILEALACGLPVLAPAIGGIPEIITPDCGMLFQAGNVDDMTSKMELLLSNLSAYNVQVIRKYATNNYSPEVVSKKFDQMYHLVIGNRDVSKDQSHI